MPAQPITIDLNCDLGESTHEHPIELQASLFPYLTSCNIACGFHGGDPIYIEQAIRLALKHKLRIGAHPSYPDRKNFGRHRMLLPAAQLQAIIRYQVAALKGMVESLGGRLSYVKPHGALYHQMATEEDTAKIVIKTIKEIDPDLALMGLAGSALQRWATTLAIPFVPEAFADRRYTQSGQLAPRSSKRAVIGSPEEVVRQVQLLLTEKQVKSIDGGMVTVHAESLCLHGDHPKALENANALDAYFAANNIQKRAV